MKKKILATIMIATMMFSLSACGEGKNSDTPKQTEETQSTDSSTNDEEKEAETVERDFPEGTYSDMGSGTFSIQTASGSSADGSVPVIFVDEDAILTQIGYLADGMDGSRLSYIYIDGMEISKEQLGEMVQGSLNLQDDALSIGVHTVEVVQYSTDEPSENIITYKTCQYEVKSK